MSQVGPTGPTGASFTGATGPAGPTGPAGEINTGQKPGASFGLSYSTPYTYAVSSTAAFDTSSTTDRTIRFNVLNSAVLNVISNQSGFGTVISFTPPTTGPRTWLTGTIALNFAYIATTQTSALAPGVAYVPLASPQISNMITVQTNVAFVSDAVKLYRSSTMSFAISIPSGGAPIIFFPFITPNGTGDIDVWGLSFCMSVL